MNKKIILLVAVLLIVAVVFVACKGKGDVDEPTTDSPTSGSSIIIDDKSDELDSGILPGVIVDGDMSGDDVINIGGQEGNNDNNSNSGEDSIEWNVIIGN